MEKQIGENNIANSENELFLKEQIITYIGNKRKLLPYIESVIKDIIQETGEKRFRCADLFSGSGIVARMLKKYSSSLIVNDMEGYSRVINECYLTNKEDFDELLYEQYKNEILKQCENLQEGIIAQNYAPKDKDNIQKGERVFFTPRNAKYIDTVRKAIDSIDEKYRKFFIAPLLYEASVHANTSGVFKGFYKSSKTGIGKYGGDGENCLNRILADIEFKKPVLSNFSSEVLVYQEDTNKLAKKLKDLDIVYLDPPYNQHGYGSNYFMLNTILNNKLGKDLSSVSGIPNDWNRSSYNKKGEVLKVFEELIKDLDSRYIIISYNSEGFMSKEDITNMLIKHGELKTIEIKYNTFRGSRNLKDRDIYVNEYLFVLKKEDC